MDFLSRDELLGGLPARRASTLLFAIESRTANLVIESRQATARFLTEKSAAADEHEFLGALAEGRDAPTRVTIRDLEHYAPEWALLVPPDPSLRAALAHLLADKYRFTARHTPRIRRALGLDDEAVRAAYERHYSQPLATIYAQRLAPREHAAWLWARLTHWLEDLPPFWTAYALTLTETVGAGILALPIAFAGVGPIAGVVLLVVLGLVNIITIAGISEAVARNGSIRYGQAYFGRVVSDYLGRPGAAILTLSLVAFSLVILLAYYIGFSTTLADATGVHAAIWAALLFLVQAYFLRRKTLNTTIASALLVGFVNIILLVTMSLLALPHVSMENLSFVNVPFVGGMPAEPAILGLIFGVVLTGYFGHLSTGACARVVLRREPHGRALIRGNVAAMATAMVLSVLWVLAVNGVVSPDTLGKETGTAIAPLVPVVGPWLTVCGLVFAVLSMGMASVHYSLALANQMREWLPEPSDVPGRRLLGAVLGEWGRYAIGLLPVAVALGVVEWRLLSGQGSFAGLFWIFGVIIPVLGGIFPVLMLAASRRKGDCAVGASIGWVGWPVVLGAVYLIFLVGVFLHGLVIWQEPIQRLVAIATGLLIIGLTVVVVRRGSFAPRSVVEWRDDQTRGGETSFTVTIDGRPAAADVQLRYFNGELSTIAPGERMAAHNSVSTATFRLPAGGVRELKVWLHQITADGRSRGLHARLELSGDGVTHRLDLGQSNGQALLPLSAAAYEVQVTFP